MRSPYGTLLSLTEWFEYLELNPWLGGQFSKYRKLDPPNTLESIQKHWRASKDACDDPYFERIYHNGKVSRLEISRAIKQAEEKFTIEMGFPPGPVAYTETIEYPQHYDPTKPLAGGMITHKGLPKCLSPKYENVQSLGVFQWEFLGYFTGDLDDLNDDGVQETMILNGVVAPLDTLCNELFVYFRDTDFPLGGTEDNLSPEPQWRIYPIEGTMTGSDEDNTFWQLRIPAWETVLPKKQISEFPLELVANVDNNFATSFRVFRRTIDTTQNGFLNYDKISDCTRTTREDCFILTQNRTGDLICPSPNFTTSLCANRFPNSVEVNYVAGCDLQACGRLSYLCGQAVAFLSAAMLACEPCGCGCHGRMPLHWYSEMYKERMAENSNRDVWILGDSKEDRQNPFGPRNGEVMAWRLVKDLRKKKIYVGDN